MSLFHTVAPSGDRVLAIGGFVLGLATILGALGSQYIGGLYPCELCLTQRLPYYIGLPALAVLIVFWSVLPRPVRLALTVGVGAIFVWGTGLGVYHAGVEWGVFQGPTSCSGTGDAAPLSLDMLGDLSGAQVVACNAVQWELFGISLAGYNALISAAIVALLGLSLKRQLAR
ncbi:disulfide bond formation protein B [Pelagibacterium limicola]|uniref:disulfide bond formation protein B n=1 Tax=Pelagibacterium limicola TaxID=2791022 RepID=UPI0018AFB630|nr:disulfide bond formation protein B [Pelagibacterium limicola]